MRDTIPVIAELVRDIFKVGIFKIEFPIDTTPQDMNIAPSIYKMYFMK